MAHQAVESKIKTTLSAIGNTVTLSPVGYVTGSAANNALTNSQLEKVKALDHIRSITVLLNDNLQTEGTTASPSASGEGSVNVEGQSSQAMTSLRSPTKVNSKNGTITSGGFTMSGSGKTPVLPDNFSLPISAVGTSSPTDPATVGATSLKATSGAAFKGNSNQDVAMVSESMAKKNNLKVGSTFSAYGHTLKVVALFKSNIQSGDDYLVLPLATAQRLSNRGDVATKAVATVDSLTNLKVATNSIKQALGSSADVSSNIDQANRALEPLQTVKQISVFSLLGAVVASIAIVCMSMVMIVRERKREIGILKAVGFSNFRIMGQFIVEALTLTCLSLVIGIGLSAFAGRSVISALVSNGGQSSTPASNGMQAFANPNFADLQNVQAAIGWDVLLLGIIGAIILALVSSSITSYFISKIRPAEVLRSE